LAWINYLAFGRLPEWQKEEYDLIFNSANNLSAAMQWIILYYFVFELKLIQVKLKSLSLKEMQKKTTRARKLKYILMGAFSTLLMSFIIVNFLWTYWKCDNEPDKCIVIQYVDYIIRVTKICLDVFVASIFLDVFLFFIEKKK
jgi:hypothetical protein